MPRKAKFKIVSDSPMDGMIFIEGPNDSLLGMDFKKDTHKERLTQAKKIVKLLNTHWADDTKAKNG